MAGLLWEGRGFPLQCWALLGLLWGRLTSGHPLCSGTVPARGKGYGGEQDLLEKAQLPRRLHEDSRLRARDELDTALPSLGVTWEAEGSKWRLKITL